MKAAFLFLVLINLAYLGWQTWIVPTKAPPALIEADNVPRLVLVDEDPDDPAFSAPYTSPNATTDWMQNAAAELAPTQLAPADQQTGIETDSTLDEQIEQQIAQQVDGQNQEAATTNTPEPRQERIEAAAVAIGNGALAPVEIAMAPVGLRCVSLGPFLNLREATEASAVLIESGMDPTQRLSESQVWFGHWVHLPPQASRQAAIAVVEELKKQGVTDIYIEPSGPMQNSISLGVFSDRKYAETRAGAIRKYGISPQIRDRYRDSSVYWVDFELPEGQSIDPSEYQASPRRVLRLEGRTCPEDT